MKNTKLILTLAILATLAIPSIAMAHAKRDPTTTAIRIGSTGGGDGDVIFKISNANDPNPVVSLTVTLTNTDNSAIRSVQSTPTGWTASALLFQNGKAVQVTWSTTSAGVTSGNSLNGFDVKMAGSTPYNFNWSLGDTVGATFSGSLSLS